MTKSKSVIATVALALAGVIGIGYVGASVACNSWNPVQWVNRTPTEITRPADDESKSWGKAVNTATGEVLKETETYALPTGVMFMSERSESEIATAEYTAPTITFTAAINNEYLNIPLTLPKSTEYLEVTPVNANTFTVKCLKPFGEKQKLTVTSTLDSTVKLECEVDYLVRLYETETAVVSSNYGFGGEYSARYYYYKNDNEGTISADGYNIYGYVYINERFGYVEEIKKLLTFDIEFTPYEFKISAENVKVVGNSYVEGTTTDKFQYSYLIKNWDSYNEQQQNAIKYAWYVVNSSADDDMVTNDAQIEYIVNGNVIFSGRRDLNNINPSWGYDSSWSCPEGEALAPIGTLTPDKNPIL